MRMKRHYPISVKMYREERKFVFQLFRKVQPHKEVFIGVCELEGSFLCEDPQQTYDSLIVGELLELTLDDTDRLNVKRQNGTFLGIIPYTDAVLPKMISARGLKLFAYFEAKDFTDGLLEIVVSMYCEKY